MEDESSTKMGVRAPGTRRGADAITMKDVARIAGVSTITVSRALSDPDKVSGATLTKVMEAVERTGYVPNLLAGALASNRSHLIAAAVPSIANPIYSEMLHSFNAALKSARYQVLFGEYEHSAEQEEKLVEAVLSRRPDGVLLTGVQHTARCRRMLLGSKIPVVEIWDMTETPIDLVVGFSHDKVGIGVADYAVERGYRSFGVITADDQRALLRLSGFEQRIQKLTGHRTEVYKTSAASLQAGRAGLAQLVAALGENPILFCSSDLLAHGALIEASARGLRIPQDIGIMGFGDQQFARHTYPALSSVEIDRKGIGRFAAEVLLDRFSGRAVQQPRRDVGFEVVERETS